MATNNNLTDFLTAVADAIREKNGTTDAINPQDMPGMIATICNTSPVFFTTADNSDTNVSALCTSIANAIRAKKSYDSTKLINPQDFPEEIRGIVTRSYMTITLSEASNIRIDGNQVTLPAGENEITPTTSLQMRFTVSGTSYYMGERVTAIDCSHLDTSTFTSMWVMFYQCKNVPTIDVSRFKTSNVTDMSFMFSYCSALTTLDVSGFDTHNVTDMRCMFYVCSSEIQSLDVSNWDTTNVGDLRYIFGYCYGLKDIIFGAGWGKQTSTAENALTLDLSNYTNYYNSYLFTAETYESMLTMYDRATAGLTNMTIKVKNTTNAPENWTANMQARGYTITVG